MIASESLTVLTFLAPFSTYQALNILAILTLRPTGLWILCRKTIK